MNSFVTLSNLALYIPENPGPAPAGALFLKSEDGADWYQAQIHFAADTRKIGYNKDGVIRIQHCDVHSLWPIDMSVTEVLEGDIPEGFPASGESVTGWIYQDGLIILAPVDYIAIAETHRDNEMAEVSKRITALVEAQDDGDITDSEMKELAALRDYRSQLRRLEVSKAAESGFTWPKKNVLAS